MKNKDGNGKLEIGSWEEADRAMADLAAAEAARRTIQADIESEIASVHVMYQKPMDARRAEIAELQTALAKFAKAHKKEFRPREDGGETRSHEHAGVVMGFRLTAPAVRIENEPNAIKFLEEFAKGVFLRVKAEPDRQALADVLKDDSDPAVEKLAAHGITLQQKDKFFCEVKEQK